MTGRRVFEDATRIVRRATAPVPVQFGGLGSIEVAAAWEEGLLAVIMAMSTMLLVWAKRKGWC